jgi:DNA-binding response OmpR family regulator
MRILVVEDETELREAVVRRLRALGHAVDDAGSRREAEGSFEVHQYGLVVLDRGLPDGDGLLSLRRWRRAASSVPVLMLTAQDAVQARVDGLEAGADDYLVKPFAMDELLARVAVIARRAPAAVSQVVRVADLELDYARAEVRRGGVLLPLRAKEFAVLAYLCGRRGCVVARDALREACWDEAHEPGSNVDEVVVSSLRRKLGPPPLITTRRGLGYVIDG